MGEIFGKGKGTVMLN